MPGKRRRVVSSESDLNDPGRRVAKRPAAYVDPHAGAGEARGRGRGRGRAKAAAPKGSSRGTPHAADVADLEEQALVAGEGASSGSGAAVEVQPPFCVIRKNVVDDELAKETAVIGRGVRGAGVYHSASLDVAVVTLDLGCSLMETNTAGHSIFYFVQQAEDGQLEWTVNGDGYTLSKHSEIVVPPGASYELRNNSKSAIARLDCIVPRA